MMDDALTPQSRILVNGRLLGTFMVIVTNNGHRRKKKKPKKKPHIEPALARCDVILSITCVVYIRSAIFFPDHPVYCLLGTDQSISFGTSARRKDQQGA